MNINLSDDAVHALNRSAAAAAREDLDAVEPRHILAGVLSEADPAVVDALNELGIARDELPGALLDVPATYEGHLPFTETSHGVLTAAVEFSTSQEHPSVTGLHLLLGVAETGDPTCSRALEEMGLRTDLLEAEVKRAYTS